MITNEIANLKTSLGTYNKHYDNPTYTELRNQIAIELHPGELPERAEQYQDVVQIMNHVISTALELCGSTIYAGSHRRLAFHLVLRDASNEIINEVVNYLEIFPMKRHYIVQDFQACILVYRLAFIVQDMAEDAGREASAIHGWQGRAAHYLLYAAYNTCLTACTLLNDLDNNQHAPGQTIYAVEKLRRTLNNVKEAIREGQQHSPHADRFQLESEHVPQAEEETT